MDPGLNWGAAPWEAEYTSGGSSPVLMHNVITQNQAAVGAGICIYETSTDAAGRSASPMSAQRAHSEIESIGIKLVARPWAEPPMLSSGSSAAAGNLRSRSTSRQSGGSSVAIAGCTVSNNKTGTEGYGAGLAVINASAVLTSNEICGNSLGGIYVSGDRCAAFDNTVRDNSGDGMYIVASFNDKEYLTEVTGNAVSANAGVGIYVQAGDEILLKETLLLTTEVGDRGQHHHHYTTIRQNEVTGNTGSSFGGIYIEGPGIVEDNVIEYNTAANSAGGVNMVSSGAALRGNTIRFNSARRAGGVVAATRSTVIEDNWFEGNTATEDGGAVYVSSASYEMGLGIISNVFKGNEAARGGAVFLNGEARLEDNRFEENRAHVGGAAIYARSTTDMVDSDRSPVPLPDSLNTYSGNTPDDFSCYDLEFTGAVKHADGSPLPGIEVRIQEIRAGGGEWIVMTDENGVFQPEDWVTIDGRVIVTPITPGYVYTPESRGVSAPWETPEFVATPQS